jgi:hypothetical protein
MSRSWVLFFGPIHPQNGLHGGKMARPTATDRARKKVVEDHEALVLHRVRALKKMRRPSREFLLSVINDHSNPSRLLYIAAELLDDGDRLRAVRRKAASSRLKLSQSTSNTQPTNSEEQEQ